MHRIVLFTLTLVLMATAACSNAEADKAAADAKQKAFMEAESQARAAQEKKESAAKLDAATQKCGAGDAAGCIALGKLKLEAKDQAGGLKAFDDACALTSKEGCTLAAQASEEPAMALARWQKGCALDDAGACVSGVGAADAMAKVGIKVEAGTQEKLLDRACDLGINRTCTALGVLTAASDAKTAQHAFERGCAKDEPTACMQLAAIEKAGKHGRKGERKVAELLKKACDLGLTEACAK